MAITLNKIELVRLEKLLMLYQLEHGDEISCASSDIRPTSALELSEALRLQDLEVSTDTLQSILDKKLAISDELAESIEQAFLMSPGWLSE